MCSYLQETKKRRFPFLLSGSLFQEIKVHVRALRIHLFAPGASFSCQDGLQPAIESFPVSLLSPSFSYPLIFLLGRLMVALHNPQAPASLPLHPPRNYKRLARKAAIREEHIYDLSICSQERILQRERSQARTFSTACMVRHILLLLLFASQYILVLGLFLYLPVVCVFFSFVEEAAEAAEEEEEGWGREEEGE